jgi:sodium transport system permease protein
MNWRTVRLIFLREVRDQLRDRRTLFMIAVLPLLLYPGLGVGMMQMTVLFSEQPRTVVVLGAKELPPPQLLDGGRFVSNWFDEPSKSERLRVVTEDSLNQSRSDHYQELADLLAAARGVREAHREYEHLANERQQALASGDLNEARRLAAHLEAAGRRRSQLFSGSGIQVLILVPPGMREKLAEANGLIRERSVSAGDIEIPKPVVLYNVADEKSLVAYTRVRQVLDAWETQLLKDRLRMANLPEGLPSQVAPQTVDLARAEERSRSVWSKLFPALLVLMTVTGAFYPAVDLAAGEKERGTMETLLICPASRSEIVFGKFLTVMLFSVCTALLNLLGMGLTGKYMASFTLGGALSKAGSLAPPPLAALAWVMVLLVPLAALFSALCLALATFARSSKEGQYYLTPILLVTVGLTVFCLSPAVEITPLYSVLPVLGVSLLLKELLAGNGAYAYLIPVLVANLGYAALALWWAVEQFSREEVLFREAERFELKLWLRQLLRDKGTAPSFAEAGFCFVLIMLMQFGAMKVFADAAASGRPGDFGVRTLQLLMIQQIAIVASPALLMGVMLTSSVRKTFRLGWPGLKFMAVGAILPLALMPLSETLAQHLSWFFPPLPDSIVKTLTLMSTDRVPLWLTVVAFALAPGFCEEIAFRGFILSGFLRSRRTWLAIGLSSVAFGAMHMIPQQVFNATLLGLVLGLLAVRSGSLWPGVLFHFLFNGTHVVLGRVAPSIAEEGYSWPVLAVCGIVSVALIRWLVVTGRATPQRDAVHARPTALLEEEIPLHVG